MNRDTGDVHPRRLRPDLHPPPVPLEPGDIQRRIVIGGAAPEVDVEIDTGAVGVIITNQIYNDNIYHGDRADAKGPPHFISMRPRVSDNYVQYRIGGERPMRLVILKDRVTVYRAIINTGRSCMRIYFNPHDPNFIVRLRNNHDRVQARFPLQ